MSKKWAVFFLLAVVTVTVFFGLTLPRTAFDYDFEKFFKPDDESTKYFEKHRNTFGTDNDFILIGIVNYSGAFESNFLTDIKKLTEEVKTLPHVKDVVSPSTLKNYVREPLTGVIFQNSLIRGDRIKDSIRVFADPSLVDNIFSSTSSAVSIVVITDPKLSKDKSDEISDALYETLSSFNFDEKHLAGRAIGQVVYINKIQNEFGLFMGIALVFIVVLLFLMFRSFRGVIIPLATVLIAVVWSIGILNLSGKGISILLNMLPPVIFVVGMSDAVHLYSRFLEELRAGATKARAIHQTIYDTGLAALFTSITTAIGFASLYLTGIPALQEFGIITAAGVIAAYVISITMLPAWLVLTDPPQKTIDRDRGNWQKYLEGILNPVIKYRKWVFLATAILTLLLSVAVSNLELNNYILEDLKPEEPLRKDFTFFDKKFAGVRPFELGLKLKNGDDSFLTPENMSHLNSLEIYLKKNYGVHAILSPLAAARESNRMRHGGKNDFYRIPDSKSDWNRTRDDLKDVLQMGKLKPVLAENEQYARVSGRTGDFGAQYFDSANTALLAFVETEGIGDVMNIEVTGTGTLIDRTNQNLVFSLAKGLGTAFLLIAILMGIMFRSLKMVLIALVPNLLPLLAIGALMAVLGIDLKMSTSIIFTIAFGIAVDDTIHLLSRYKLEMVNGRSHSEALRKSFTHTGKALIITSIILFGGFISLCFSSFQSTFYIGLLVTVTLFFALFFDLTILPALLSRKADN